MLDHDTVEEYTARLGRIAPGASAFRGQMTRDALIDHLADVVRLSMGRGAPRPRRDTRLCRMLWRLVRKGYVRIPRFACRVEAVDSAPPRADLESLHALLLEYLAMVQAGEAAPLPHPCFGDIGVDGWARFHTLHFEHHLSQFGV